MLWEWRGIANMDFIQLGGSSRVGEMILARERSGFAGEKVQEVPGEKWGQICWRIFCTVLVSTVLQTDIGTRVLGMKEEDKVVVCILLETETLNRATGITGFSLFPLLKILHKLDNHLLPFFMPKSLMQSSLARRIAEKAVVVADMDERVNRAVTAANRTASAASVAAVKACLAGGVEVQGDGAATIRLGYRNVLIEERNASFFFC
ncbi:hypothetical protein Tco_0674899 [Tanacetum coccineum]